MTRRPQTGPPLPEAWLAATAADPAEQLTAAVDLDNWLPYLGNSDPSRLVERRVGLSRNVLARSIDSSVSSVLLRCDI